PPAQTRAPRSRARRCPRRDAPRACKVSAERENPNRRRRSNGTRDWHSPPGRGSAGKAKGAEAWRTPVWPSAADATHRTGRGHKIGLSDVMPGLLLGDGIREEFTQFLIGSARAQPRAQIVLVHAKQACPQLAIGRQAQPVAVPAKGFRD